MSDKRMIRKVYLPIEINKIIRNHWECFRMNLTKSEEAFLRDYYNSLLMEFELGDKE